MDTIDPSEWVCRTCGRSGDPESMAGTRCPTDHAPLVIRADLAAHPEDPILGEVIAGKFAVVGLLGIGGFGAVYRAVQSPVGRLVALKIIKPQGDAAALEHLRARFFREARVVSRLSDPATVTLYDYGETPDARLYMVFEYIDGVTLSSLLQRGPLSPERVAPLLFQVLGALAEAHRLGCVHRDLKPGNLMIGRNAFGEDTVKVLDFGIAKVSSAQSDEHSLQSSLETREGVIVGTPKFMAPEQARGLDVDARADLYALGCLAYAMLSGRPPFDFVSAVDVLMAQVSRAPAPFREHLAVPADLAAVVFKALEKNPDARFQSAEEMARSIADFTPGLALTRERPAAAPPRPTHEISPTRAGVPLPPTATDSGTSKEMSAALATGQDVPQTPAPRAAQPAFRVALGAAVVAAGAAAALLWPPPAPPPAEAPASAMTAPTSGTLVMPDLAPASAASPASAAFDRALYLAKVGDDASAATALLEALDAAPVGSPAADATLQRALSDARLSRVRARPEIVARLVLPQIDPVPTPDPAPISVAPPASTLVANERPRRSVSPSPAPRTLSPSAPPSAKLAVPEF